MLLLCTALQVERPMSRGGANVVGQSSFDITCEQ